jgi:hypothetical protein
VRFDSSLSNPAANSLTVNANVVSGLLDGREPGQVPLRALVSGHVHNYPGSVPLR